MEWRDEGILLSARRHGETSLIIEALTRAHGRHAGLVKGGRSRKLAPVLQPGAQLSLEWHARLDEHLGTYRVDPIEGRSAALMEDRAALSGFNAMSALLLTFVPEREPNAALYNDSVTLIDLLARRDAAWPLAYACWEKDLLNHLGFGVDLTSCAATGSTEDLIFVSPRSGRAVSRSAGGPWADKMLPLPQFLLGAAPEPIGAVREALKMTGWFLEHWVCPAFDRAALPEARARLIAVLEDHDMPMEEVLRGHPPGGNAVPGPRY